MTDLPIRDIRAFTNRFTARDDRLAALSFWGTFAVYFATLAAAVASVGQPLLLVPLVVVNAFAGVRLYVLQHDCGHASLFSTRARNDLAGIVLSPFTLTPYAAMRFNHNIHHQFLGDLEHRESGEIHTMTVREWQVAPWWRRAVYRIYRHPVFLLPAGGVWTYLFAYRWPKNTRRVGVAGVMASNAAVLVWLAAIWTIWNAAGLWVWLATAVVAGCVGVFLVYLQHNFEETYWDRKPELRTVTAALDGSSTLDFGWLFDLATGNIAYHDIHHFNPRIPSYRLRQCHFAMRGRFPMATIRLPQAFASFGLQLWDEEAGRLVSFAAARGSAPAGVPAD